MKDVNSELFAESCANRTRASGKLSQALLGNERRRTLVGATGRA